MKKLTAVAASLMNCLEPLDQIAGTVITQLISWVVKFKIPPFSISFKTKSRRYLIADTNTLKAFISLPLSSVIFKSFETFYNKINLIIYNVIIRTYCIF